MSIRAIALSFAWAAGTAVQAAEPPIVGKYAVKLGKYGNSAEMRLECRSETSCTFTAIQQWEKEAPKTERKQLNKVTPVTQLKYAANALKYAIDQRSAKIENPEIAEPMALLAPVLAANPSVAECWDLNYASESYMLACTLDKAPAGSPPLYLFATLMANCGEGFCGYLIYPLARVKTD